MKVTDYSYDLPESAIALHPPIKRGDSRLLVLDRNSGEMEDRKYTDLVQFLNPGDLLVINNTKVIPARLIALTENGSQRELLLLEKHGQTNDHHTSLVMYRRKINANQFLFVGETKIKVDEVYENGTAKITCNKDLWDLADDKGTVPLPPYMHRNEEKGDRERYQTEFAKIKGSVAAPTASLNMTSHLLDKIKAKGIKVAELTLHVGLGTFMPIRTDEISSHKMHQEYFEIPFNTVNAIRQTKLAGGRVIAVGTTVTRTLEYAAEKILSTETTKDINEEADIFIYPGYDFQIVDGLVTNFHAPKSTVLMMAAAFAGWDNLQTAYRHALEENYRFLSYGDSMLIV